MAACQATENETTSANENTSTPPTSLLVSTLPPEIHLVIISFLPRIAQHKLSLTCQYFRALTGPVQLNMYDTIDLRCQVAAQARGRYGVCWICARLLPFYFMCPVRFHLGVNAGPPDPHIGHCLQCKERTLSGCEGLWRLLSFHANKWSFGEWMVICPGCGRFVRCGSQDCWGEAGVEEYWIRPVGGIEANILPHGGCLYPGRTPSKEAKFLKKYGDQASDPLPLITDKLAFLEQRKEEFPASFLVHRSETPLREFQGLFPGTSMFNPRTPRHVTPANIPCSAEW